MSLVRSKAPSVKPPSPLKRSGELRSLTGLRGIAALNVALAHFNLPALAGVNALFFWHSEAVDLFFCLSGFTLALVYGQRAPSFSNWRLYAAARIARIYPLYLATLLWVALVAFPVGPHYPLDRAWSDFLAQLALVNSWPVIGTGVHWNIPAWSISVEFFCYLAVFPLLWRVRRFPSDWVAGAIILACSLAAYIALAYYFDWQIFQAATYYPSNAISYSVCIVRGILGFVSGWIVYTLYDRQTILSAFFSKYLSIVIAAIIFIIIDPVTTHFGLNNEWLLLLFPFFLLGVANEWSKIALLLGKAVPHTLGRYSYSIYLLHAPLKMTADKIISECGLSLSPSSYSAGLVVALIALSAFSFRFFETPWRNARRLVLSPGTPRLSALAREGWLALTVSIGLVAVALVLGARILWAVGPDRELVTPYAQFHLFKEGWSAFEGTHIWAVGRNSVIDLKLPQMVQAARLVMRGRTFVTVAHPMATTRISVNGSPAAAIQASLDAPTFAQEFDLPFGARTLRIVLETDRPASPKSLGVSDDARELSLSLESLQVRTIQGEDKAAPIPMTKDDGS